MIALTSVTISHEVVTQGPPTYVDESRIVTMTQIIVKDRAMQPVKDDDGNFQHAATTLLLAGALEPVHVLEDPDEIVDKVVELELLRQNGTARA